MNAHFGGRFGVPQLSPPCNCGEDPLETACGFFAYNLGGQNLYTNTVRRGPPHTPGRLFGVYDFSPLFP